MRLSSIVHFRGLAILLIVAGHSYGAANLELSTPAAMAVGNLITGGTAFFVFISGYMFHHVFYRRFRYRDFILGKIRTVALPYIAVTVPLIVYFLARNPDFAVEMIGPSGQDEAAANFALQFVRLLATGLVQPAYWYVPFIMAVFALAPLHCRYVRLPLRAQIALLVVTTSVALVAHRPVDNYGIAHSVLYFTPVYLLGILVSVYRGRLLAWLDGKLGLLFAAGLAAAGLQALLGSTGNSHKALFAFAGIDLMLVQKMILCVAVFALLERVSAVRLPALESVSETSFAIFFLHPIVLLILAKTGATAPTGLGWIDLAWTTAIATAISVAIAVTAKALSAGRSRFVLGY